MTAPTLDIIQRFAPMVYLHPYDNHRPTSVEAFLSKTRLYSTVQERREVAAQVTADTLVQYNHPSYYLDYPQSMYPTGHNDFTTGDNIAAGSDASFGICRAPMYVKTFDRGTHVDIKYAFFYEFNGPQMFRVGIRSGLTTRKRTFMWHRFARHLGDWEHITVRLTPDCTRLMMVFYGQHGESEPITDPSFVDGTHPVVYSALSSHASYPKMVIQTDEEIDAAVITGRIAWLKAVDTTEPGDVVVYNPPSPLFSRIEWAPWKHGSALVVVDDNPAASKWLNFQGRFGPQLDNSNIDRPPSMTLDAHDVLFDFAKLGKGLNFIGGKRLKGEGPPSPQQQDWWNSKEP